MKIWQLTAVVIMLLGGFGVARAHQDGGIIVYDVWASPTTSADHPAEVVEAHHFSIVSMQVENRSAYAVALTGAVSPAASTALIFETPERASETIVILAGERRLIGSTDDAYVALTDLPQHLLPNTSIPLTLTFANFDEVGDEAADQQVVTVGALVQDNPPIQNDVIVYDAWARPTATPQSLNADLRGIAGALYFTLENRGQAARRLVSAAVDGVERVELHRMEVDAQGVMRMGRYADGVEIPAGETFAFAAGGSHLMLMGLSADLLEGQAVRLTLTFDDGAVMTLGVPVYDKALRDLMGG